MIGSNPLIVGLDQGEREAVIAQATTLSRQWRDGETIRMPGTAFIAIAMKPKLS
jgi:hypothetical protein